MKSIYLQIGAGVLALPLLAGCVKDDYDLSDIDTTTQIKVENLVIPVNIDKITLGDIITFDDDSKIKPVTIGGETFYALIEDGNFKSDPIEIKKVTAAAPVLAPTEAYLDPIIPQIPMVDLPFDPSDLSVTYKMTEMGNDINFNAGKIDEAIQSLDFVNADISFAIKLEAMEMGDVIKDITFSDIVFQLPRGLVLQPSTGTYNSATGEWNIPSISASDYSLTLSLRATGVDFVTAGASINANHEFSYNGSIKILSGQVKLTPNLDASQLPGRLHFRASYEVSDLVANSFSGKVNYQLDGININPVSLGDVPDFLSGEGTNISLANPQIYLQVNNPVAVNNLRCETGITLSAIREGAPTLDFTPGNPFTIGYNAGVTGPYNFVLTPSMDNINVPDRFSTGLTFVKFETLGNLLSTPAGFAKQGLPEQIGIKLDSPQIPTQSVTDFALGRSLEGVEGSYELVAPLALTSDALIIYTDTQDGWGSEDLDAVTVSKLSVTANVTNECPLGVSLVAWPIDKEGNRIPGVEVKSNFIEANSANVAVVIEMTGTIKNLDGVIFEARVTGSSDNSALTPAQSITLTDIRACVTGYYEKKL
ncbi:MAG: DUF11 domain-containing protein [Muribaculaceae bacterium]|nr:DUF11 domain-containing protein [Muribaculaceae bacterium]